MFRRGGSLDAIGVEFDKRWRSDGGHTAYTVGNKSNPASDEKKPGPEGPGLENAGVGAGKLQRGTAGTSATLGGNSPTSQREEYDRRGV